VGAGCWILLFVAWFLPAGASAHIRGEMAWLGWSFQWEVSNRSGLALRDLRFNRELVLYKASMPAMRVEYEGGRKFLERIDTGTLRDCTFRGRRYGLPGTGDRICTLAFTDERGTRWLELSIRADTRGYWIVQRYSFSETGMVQVSAFSQGQFVYDSDFHIHHFYWRFDFDVVDAANDQVFRFDDDVPGLLAV
jgi:hypothetical protein